MSIGDNLPALLIKPDAFRHRLLDELDPSLLHIIPDLISHMLIKPSQEDRPDHNGDITAQPVKEPSTLKRYITSTNDQGFFGTLLLPEYVVGGDGQLLPGNARA